MFSHRFYQVYPAPVFTALATTGNCLSYINIVVTSPKYPAFKIGIAASKTDNRKPKHKYYPKCEPIQINNRKQIKTKQRTSKQ